MRVLHVYSGNLFGGIEAILATIARGRALCPAIDHEFALCFEGRLADELARAGARVLNLGRVRLAAPTSVQRARQTLTTLLKTGSFDRVICHAPWAHGIFAGVARRAGVPLVFWAHDVPTGSHWTERLARRVKPDLAICNSRFTAATLHRLFAEVETAVVYAPVELTRRTRDDDRRRIRASLNTPEQTIVIVQASRSEAWKGHAVLLQALAELRREPNWICWQVGGAQRPAEGAYLTSLKQLAKRSGIADRVRWLGERDDVPQILAAADLYCQANVEPEPFGVVFVEALAAGLPVVTSGMGGACEIVDENCGRLVPPREPLRLAEALRTLVGDEPLRSALAGAAPARARRLCDPAVALQRLSDVLARMTPETVSA